MDAEHPPIHHRSQTQIIKHVTAVPPHVHAPVLPLALVVESVDLGDLARLVVPSNERESIWIADFESQEEKEGLDGVETSIDEVTLLVQERGRRERQEKGSGRKRCVSSRRGW